MSDQKPAAPGLGRRLLTALDLEYRRFLDGKENNLHDVTTDARQRCISLLKLRREVFAIDPLHTNSQSASRSDDSYLLKIFISYPFSDASEKDMVFRAFEQACRNRGHRAAQGGGIDDRRQWQSNFTPMINQRISDCDGFVLYMGPQAIKTSVPTISDLTDIVATIKEQQGAKALKRQVEELHSALLNYTPKTVGFTMKPWLLWECGVAYNRGLPIDYLGHDSIVKDMKQSVFQGLHVTPVTDQQITEPSDASAWGLVGVFEEALDRVEAEWLTRLSTRLAHGDGKPQG